MTDPKGMAIADRARQIVEGLGEGFLGLDADWRVTDCNDAVLRFLDRRREELLGRKVWELVGLTMNGPFGLLAQRVARTAIAEDAEIAHRKDGDKRLLTVRIFPLGAGIGAILRDITKLRESERRLAESEAKYRELADGTPAAAWLSRPDGELEFINRAMAEALGRSREALLGLGWMVAIDPDDRPAMLKVRDEALRSYSAFHYEGRFRRPDGTLRIIQLDSRPRFDCAGAFRGHVGMATDVTEAREAERRQELLIGELNHRVKNTLATVQSVVSQTLRDAGVAQDVTGVVTGRLMALSAAHNVLNQERWEGADLAEIAEALAAPYAAERISITGPKAQLEPNTALTLAMGLHELAVNAVKHGALSTPCGQVQLSWTLVGDAAAALQWREDGGPPVAAPERSGFGVRLLSRGLGAELDYAPDGLTCRMRVAVRRVATS